MKIAHHLPSLAILFVASTSWGAPIIWTGPTTTFSKAANADPTQAANQDRLTNSVWLTRASTAGLFNINTETSFTHNVSPSDTAWAFGTTASYSSLTYTDWETWTGGSGSLLGIIGQDAVVHLISDDIYVDLKFTSWADGHSAPGGAFSYQRSTASAPEPGTLGLLGAAFIGLLTRRQRNQKFEDPKRVLPKAV